MSEERQFCTDFFDYSLVFPLFLSHFLPSFLPSFPASLIAPASLPSFLILLTTFGFSSTFA